MIEMDEDLEIECLDLVLDEKDPLRCHLIKSDTGEIVDSGTRYLGEDGEVHIEWDAPRFNPLKDSIRFNLRSY